LTFIGSTWLARIFYGGRTVAKKKAAKKAPAKKAAKKAPAKKAAKKKK
jgi:hypothetical protein